MSTSIGPIYHWSPRDRLPRIKRLGLMPGMRSPRLSQDVPEDADIQGWWQWRAPYVCFSTTPATAWNYALVIRGVTYDLWEAYLKPSDEVYVMPMWGDAIQEVRVYNRILKSRLNFVGERTALRGRNPA